MLLGAVALLRRWFWARLYALGISAWGIGGLGSFIIGPGITLWEVWLPFLGFILLGVLLLGPRTARYFEGQDLWRVGVWRSWCLAWAVVLNVAMLHALVVYLLIDGEWIDPGTRALTVVITGTSALSLVLLLRRRTAGLLLLGLGGIGALILAVDAALGLHRLLLSVWAHPPCVTAYLENASTIEGTKIALAGIIPGALAGVGAVALFGRDLVRYLRG